MGNDIINVFPCSKLINNYHIILYFIYFVLILILKMGWNIYYLCNDNLIIKKKKIQIYNFQYR